MTLGIEFASILGAAQQGAEWAVNVLYRDLNPAILRYLRAKEPGEAEDLAGEVWLAVVSQLASFEGDEAGFRGWVFTIASRRVADLRRKQRRRRTDLTRDGYIRDAAAPLDPAAAVMDALDAQAAVDRLVRALPPEQAEVVLLRVVAGLDVAHVASVMGKSPGSVRVLQHRALKRLAERFVPKGVTER
jgi:RNA polymerase sigma-70 factor (ECF subfamily)